MPAATPHPQLGALVGEFNAKLQRQREAHGKPYDTQAEVDLMRAATLGLVQRYRSLGAQGRPEHLHGALQLVQRSADREAMTRVSVNTLRAFRPGDALTLQRLADEHAEQAAQARQAQQEREETLAQRQAELEAELAPTVQRQARQEASQENVHERLQALRGAGDALPEAVQRQLHTRLHVAPEYLAKVRVHTGSEAHGFAKGIGALAATSGSDIFFQSGQYQPNSQSGLELLGHEVKHVEQQLAGRVQGAGIDPDAGLETEAKEAGKRMLAAGDLPPAPATPAPTPRATPASTLAAVQRQSVPQPFSSAPPISQAPWHRDFSGTVAGQDVQVSLRRSEDKLHGRYQYRGKAGWLTLEGHVRQEDGRKFAKLIERDEKRQITGVFQGEFKGERGETLLGTWTSHKGRSFDFSFALDTVHPLPQAEPSKDQPQPPQQHQQPKTAPPKWARAYGGTLADSALSLHLRQEGGTLSGAFTLGAVGGGTCEGKQEGHALTFTATYTTGKYKGQTRTVNATLQGDTGLSGDWSGGAKTWPMTVKVGVPSSGNSSKPASANANAMQKAVIAALPQAMKKAGKVIRTQDVRQHVPLILEACRNAGVTDPAQIAYILMTAGWESVMGMDGWMVERVSKEFLTQTGGTEEQYFESKYGHNTSKGKELGNTEPGDGFRYRGRGFVQLTGRANYSTWTNRLKREDFKVNGQVPDLLTHPELVTTNKVLAAKILAEGMRDGTFTGKKLAHYLSTANQQQDFRGARRIINGQDAAQQLADGAAQLLSGMSVDEQQAQALKSRELPDDQKRHLVARGMAAWGTEIGEVNGVKAFFNAGDTGNKGRNYSTDGKLYDYGLRWQCVEFVRRYYYDKLGHAFSRKGHAHSYFNADVEDGAVNGERGLVQYKNGSKTRPAVHDLIVFAPHGSNGGSGHVAIVMGVSDEAITVAQQNVDANFTGTFKLVGKEGASYHILSDYAPVFGWLRK